MFRGFILKHPTKIRSSAQHHALLHLLLNTVGFFISARQKSAWWKWFVPQLYQLRRGILEGPALKYFYMSCITYYQMSEDKLNSSNAPLQKSPAKEPCKRALQKSPIFPQKSPICHRISEDKSNSSNAPLQKSLQKSPIVPQKSPIYYRISEDKSNSSNASVARAAPL